VFAHQASIISESIEAIVRQRIFQFSSYYLLSISGASEGSCKRVFEYLDHSFAGVKDGNMLLQDFV
jgi:hypothetical protein